MTWDKTCYPESMTRWRHAMHMKLMVLVWPSVGDDTALAHELHAQHLRFGPAVLDFETRPGLLSLQPRRPPDLFQTHQGVPCWTRAPPSTPKRTIAGPIRRWPRCRADFPASTISPPAGVGWAPYLKRAACWATKGAPVQLRSIWCRFMCGPDRTPDGGGFGDLVA